MANDTWRYYADYGVAPLRRSSNGTIAAIINIDVYPSARRQIVTLTPEIALDLPASNKVVPASVWLLSPGGS